MSYAVAAKIFTEPTLEPGAPRWLFDGTYLRWGSAIVRTYDLSPDDKTFVMLQDLEEAAQTERFQMIENWFEVLRQVAPAQR